MNVLARSRRFTIAGSVTLVALLSVVILGGCGIPGAPGQAKSSKTTFNPQLQSTTSTIPYTWPPQVVANAGDVAKATSISAQQVDFPADWSENSDAPTTTPDNAVIDEAFVQCMFGAQPSALTAYVVSPVMASGDGNQIAQSFVRVVGSVNNARNDFANFKPARASACETAMYTRQFSLPAGTKIIGKKFGFDPPDTVPSDTLLSPDGSNDIIGIRFFVSPRDTSPVYEDLFAYGVGRFEVVELFQDSQNNPDADAESGALKLIKQRANAASQSS
jgi:hypothetical protein